MGHGTPPACSTENGARSTRIFNVTPGDRARLFQRTRRSCTVNHGRGDPPDEPAPTERRRQSLAPDCPYLCCADGRPDALSDRGTAEIYRCTPYGQRRRASAGGSHLRKGQTKPVRQPHAASHLRGCTARAMFTDQPCPAPRIGYRWVSWTHPQAPTTADQSLDAALPPSLPIAMKSKRPSGQASQNLRDFVEDFPNRQSEVTPISARHQTPTYRCFQRKLASLGGIS